MGNTGGTFKSNVDSVDIELDFEIDPNKGQDELRKFGYYFNKKGECRSITNDERVGRFPSQKKYEEFGAALERYIFFLLKDQYKMTEILIKSTNDHNDSVSDNLPVAVPLNDSDNDQPEHKEDKTVENESKTSKKAANDNKPQDNDINMADNDNYGTENTKKGMVTKTKKQNKPKQKPKRKDYSQIASDKIAKSRIYVSPDYGSKETLLLLIPGSGAVRAGQWARSICINDNLAAGCMYPFISEAYKRDWGVICFDPNGRTERGRVFSDDHVMYVYDRYVEQLYLSKAECLIKNVLIICHSAGGMATTRLLNDKRKYLLPRIRAVAGTDTFFGRAQNKAIQQVYGRSIVNWVTSTEPLGTILSHTVPKRVSAGHAAHEYTSAAAFPQIMSYFDAMLKSAQNQAVNDKSLATETSEKQLPVEEKNEDVNNKKVEEDEAKCEGNDKEDIQTDIDKQAKDMQGNSDKSKETPKNNEKMEVDNE